MGLLKNKRPSVSDSYGMTDIGLRREKNEDTFLLLKEKRLFIVSDGMGGHNAGEVACQTAVNALESFYSAHALKALSDEKISELMINSVHEANWKVWEKSRLIPEYLGMGCTLVVAFIDTEYLHVCYAGDSRVYIIDQHEIVQVTTDHSVVIRLVKSGHMSKEEAMYSGLKNQLTQAVGIASAVSPEYIKRPIKKNDTVLLCTDGLWNMLDDDEIRKVISEGNTPKECCRKLISRANDEGGNDNITVVVVHI